jgi:peptidyl-dipeptidase A
MGRSRSGSPELLMTPGEVAGFLARAEERLLELSIDSQRAEWVHATFITEDTAALASRAYARLIQETVELVKSAERFRSAALSEEEARKLHLLRTSLPLVAPADPKEGEELTGLVNSLQDVYAKGKVTLPGYAEPLDLEGLARLLAQGRDPVELHRAWAGWHAVARPMRGTFGRYVELANRGAREVGFEDLGALWRSKYDMSPAAFVAETERLWREVEPLYRALHAFVRRRLVGLYGAEVVPPAGPIPAHLLGNMWAQSWENLYPLLAPPDPEGGEDLTSILVGRRTTPRQMVEHAERFFTSLGLPALPPTFWERSMFQRPRDREVVCHASAWDIDFVEDLRVKMCLEVTAEDFRTVHHELGHDYYYRAYAGQPFLFRDSAHDGFHEAIGDTISLSVTPEYLRKIGLFARGASPAQDLGYLLHRALEGVAFLPFGLLIDAWRWRVFDGSVGPREYNRSWWEYRRRYQGVAPDGARGEDGFDAGAKYHVAANVPYMRYFLAGILQYQFHRALARSIGWEGPLHRCSVYGRPEAGARLQALLQLGASRPWPDALEAMTGERRMDASALLDYFAPLKSWLDEQNRDAPVGW